MKNCLDLSSLYEQILADYGQSALEELIHLTKEHSEYIKIDHTVHR